MSVPVCTCPSVWWGVTRPLCEVHNPAPSIAWTTSTSNHDVTVTLELAGTEVAYVVRLPSMPGCMSHGKTLPEALRNLAEASELYLDALKRAAESAKEPEPAPVKCPDCGLWWRGQEHWCEGLELDVRRLQRQVEDIETRLLHVESVTWTPEPAVTESSSTTVPCSCLTTGLWGCPLHRGYGGPA